MLKSLYSSKGFTLVELMVTIAIIAILSMMAAPAVQRMVQANAVTNHVNAMVGTLQLARSEAIKNASNVVICQSVSGAACAANAGSWNAGWIVFLDRDSNGELGSQNESGDKLIVVQEEINNIGTISQNAQGRIVFNSMGLVSMGASTITFNSKNLSTNFVKLVCVSRSGRVRATTGTEETCG